MANSRMRIGAKLTNFTEMSEMLEVLPMEVANNVMGTAIDMAAKPIETHARANAPANRGGLKKSITRVVRKYPGSKVPAIAIIGPDKDFTQPRLKGGRDLKGYDRPAKTAHLIEFGFHTRAVDMAVDSPENFRPGERRTSLRVNKKNRKVRSVITFVPANPFLRNAVRQGEAAAAAGFEKGCVQGLERETKKLNRKFIKQVRGAN